MHFCSFLVYSNAYGELGERINNILDDGFIAEQPAQYNQATRRAVSIVYTDIVDSTNIISALDPDDAVDFLDTHIHKMVRAIHAYGGKVLGVNGDGIKAVFGATHSQEDHALRAALSGLEVVRSIKDEPVSSHLPRAKIRVGIDSGYVIVRWQKNDFGGGLDTVGAAAHMAAKIEKDANANSVAVSAVTADLIAEHAQLREIKSVNINTEQEQAKLYEVLSIGQDFRNTYALGMRKQHNLVGRQPELQIIKSFLSGDQKNENGALCVIGEAGIGKSRLMYAAELAAIQKNMRVEIVNGIGAYKNIPFYLLSILANKIIHRGDRDKTVEISTLLGDINLTQTQIIAMKLLLSADAQAMVKWDVPVDDKQNALQNSFVALIKQTTQHSPLVFIVEDVHDADYESLRCLQHVVEVLDNASFSLIVTSRPKNSTMARNMACVKIELHALSREDSYTLVGKNIGDGADPNMIETILTRSNGLPLALVEFSKPSQIAHAFDIMPLALEPLLRQRIDTLSPPSLKLVKYASAIGNRQSKDRLQNALGVDTASFNTMLTDVITANILHYNQREHLVFEHQLYQEVCHNSLLRDESRQIHAAIYKSLSQEKNADVVIPQVLARHAMLAENYEQALDHLWQACGDAIGQSAVKTASDLYYEAIEVCNKIGEQAQHRKVLFALKTFDAFHQLARENELLEVYEQAIEQQINMDDVNKVLVLCNIAVIKWVGGSSDVLKLAQHANDMAHDIGYFPLSAYTRFILANINHATGNIKLSIQQLTSLLSKFEGKQAAKRFGRTINIPSVMYGTFASWHCVDIGDYEASKQFWATAYKTACDENHEYSKMFCDMALGYRLYRTAHYPQALEALTRAYDIAERNLYLSPWASICGWRASVLIATGEIDLAEIMLEQELSSGILDRQKNSGKFYVYTAQAQLEKHKCHYQQAHVMMEMALKSSQNAGDPVHSAYGNYNLGILALESKNDGPLAQEYFGKALKFAEQCAMRPLEKKCRTALQKL